MNMKSHELEEVLGALRSAAAKEQLGDLLTTLLTGEEVVELGERLEAVKKVLKNRRRVFVPYPEKKFTYLMSEGLEVVRDAPPGGGGYRVEPVETGDKTELEEESASERRDRGENETS